MSSSDQSPARGRRSLVLWVISVVLMFAAADFQERTGPTKELEGSFTVGGTTYEYSFVRSGNTDADAPVTVPDPGVEVRGWVYFKRYPTRDRFTPLPMQPLGDELQALLPAQPAAGKLEYYVVLETPEGEVRVPEGETVVMRFKDPVPLGFLVPHVLFMFLALLFGVRTALAAVAEPHAVRRLARTTLGLMTVGGLILGPIVQKFAFGAFWTGWPYGYDLTDNKTLIMWLVWAIAVWVLRRRPEPGDRGARAAVLVAAVVMMTVYLIPHSLRGSEYDYGADAGAASPTGGVLP